MKIAVFSKFSFQSQKITWGDKLVRGEGQMKSQQEPRGIDCQISPKGKFVRWLPVFELAAHHATGMVDLICSIPKLHQK